MTSKFSRPTPEQIEEYSEDFAEADADTDGRISLVEFVAWRSGS